MPGVNTPLKLPKFRRVVVWTGNVLYEAEKAAACSARVNRFRYLQPMANLGHERSGMIREKNNVREREPKVRVTSVKCEEFVAGMVIYSGAFICLGSFNACHPMMVDCKIRKKTRCV